MSWNYRVMKHKREKPIPEEWFQIHEVYYNETSHPTYYSVDDIAAIGENIDELRECLQRMLQATEKPILTADDFNKLS